MFPSGLNTQEVELFSIVGEVEMKLGDYVIQYLKDIGIKRVFLVYGAAIGDLVDAFSRIKGIDYVAVIHEQGGAFAVETYAKVSGELSCFIATSGPGGINVLNSVANCYYDSVPALFITGQINSKFLRPSKQIRQIGFQENDIVGMSKPITKMAQMLMTPESVKYLLDKAVHTALSGRPGPVLLDLPIDIQKANIEPYKLKGCYVSQPTPDDDFQYGFGLVRRQIDMFIEDYKRAERPVLLIGGGIRCTKAVDEAIELGRRLQVPCLPTWNAIDIFTSDYEFYRGRVGTFGGPGRNFAIQNSDLLLSIGSRISGRITGGYVESFARAAKKYLVDIDRASLNPEYQQVKADVNIYCDAKRFIQMLLEELEGQKLPDRTWWLDRTREWRDKYIACLPEYYHETRYVHPYVFIKVLSEELEPGDTVVVDCGGNVVVTYQTFETKFGQRVVSSHGNSPMGYSFAGAMGACFVPGIKRVICLIGDGGFNMNIQELQTVKSYNLPLKTFIMNNHSYGITRQFQDTNFQSRYLASGPDGYNPPDFVKVVNAYGIKTETIKSHGELRDKIRSVISYPGAIVCDVDMGLHSRYEPRIFGWRTPIEDMHPYLPRDEFRSNMLIEPVEGWENPAIPGGKG